MSRHMGGQHGIHLPLLIGFAHSDCSALQQPHGHISQQHRHLLGPGHAAPAPVIIGHVHTEVPAVAVLGQHIAATALEVQQAAVEGAVMGVSEGHAGSWPGQAAGAAAAGTQGRGLVGATRER